MHTFAFKANWARTDNYKTQTALKNASMVCNPLWTKIPLKSLRMLKKSLEANRVIFKPTNSSPELNLFSFSYVSSLTSSVCVKYLLVALQSNKRRRIYGKEPPKSETRFIFVSIFFSSTWLIMNTICSHPQKWVYCTPRAQNPAHPQPGMFHFPRKSTNTHGASFSFQLSFNTPLEPLTLDENCQQPESYKNTIGSYSWLEMKFLNKWAKVNKNCNLKVLSALLT